MYTTNNGRSAPRRCGVIRIKGSEARASMALDEKWALGAISIRSWARCTLVAEAAHESCMSGATPVAATNCLNFGNPEKPHIMWQFFADDRRHHQGLRRT